MVHEKTLSKGIRSVFLLDLRALALLRISLSLILMTDIIFRLSDLTAFYTGQGIMPLQALFRFHWNPIYFSFFTTNDNRSEERRVGNDCRFLRSLVFIVI